MTRPAQIWVHGLASKTQCPPDTVFEYISH